MHRTHNPIYTFPSNEHKHTHVAPTQGRARTSSRKTSQRRQSGRPEPQTESLWQRRYAPAAPPHPPRRRHQRPTCRPPAATTQRPQPWSVERRGILSQQLCRAPPYTPNGPSRVLRPWQPPPQQRRAAAPWWAVRVVNHSRPPMARWQRQRQRPRPRQQRGYPLRQPEAAARARGCRQPRRPAKARRHHQSGRGGEHPHHRQVSPASTAGRRRPPVAPPAVADTAAVKSLPTTSPALTAPRRNNHHPGATTPASTAAEMAAHDLVSS